MKHSKYRILTFTLFLSVWLGRAQNLAEKATYFLNTLSAELKDSTQFEFDHPLRESFHFVPMARKGPTFKDFDSVQKNAALDLLRASLSTEGFNKATAIMELEKVLMVIDQYNMPDGTPARDPLNYHFMIFGNPGPETIWGWSFEGHHVSVNFTADRGILVSSTPSFMGSNPGIVQTELDKGKQVLKRESNLGLNLIQSLSSNQLGVARFSDSAPREIITGNKRNIEAPAPTGISYSDLNDGQKQVFMELLEVYIGNYVFEFSETFRKKIWDAGLENLYFAWAGGLQWGEPHYYRIQGPMLLIEYDNIQNNANHVHTVVRDLTNDFAEDLLKEHYQKEHQD